jgi:hypothetical protein
MSRTRQEVGVAAVLLEGFSDCADSMDSSFFTLIQ